VTIAALAVALELESLVQLLVERDVSRDSDGAVILFNPAKVTTTRYRYRGAQIPTPWEADTIAIRGHVWTRERPEAPVGL
jgi:hypothetical protein